MVLGVRLRQSSHRTMVFIKHTPSVAHRWGVLLCCNKDGDDFFVNVNGKEPIKTRYSVGDMANSRVDYFYEIPPIFYITSEGSGGWF